MYDSDGDYCAINKGFGVNSHCVMTRGEKCGSYEYKKKPKINKQGVKMVEKKKEIKETNQNLRIKKMIPDNDAEKGYDMFFNYLETGEWSD